MLVGIYDLKDPNDRDLPTQQAYEKILAHNGIPSVRLRVEQTDFWQTVQTLSLFIMRFSQHHSHLQQASDIMPVIEQQSSIKCYPDLKTGWHYDDKVRQYHMMNSIGFPMTESWVFYDRNRALDWVDQTELPVVFKLRGGAGSRNVILVKTRQQARKLVLRMFGRGILPERFISSGSLRLSTFSLFRELHHIGGNMYRRSKGLDSSPYWQTQKNYVLFQKFLPGNDWDTRVTVIGDRAFAFRRMVRDNDFRASGSGNIDYDTTKIDMRCVEIAFKISQALGFQSMAYDFLMNEKQEPEFCEISYTYVSSAVRNCPGHWDSGLNWHDGHFWPEYLHLVDALDRPDLKQPDMTY